jgi:hypothetical protein
MFEPLVTRDDANAAEASNEELDEERDGFADCPRPEGLSPSGTTS